MSLARILVYLDLWKSLYEYQYWKKVHIDLDVGL